MESCQAMVIFFFNQFPQNVSRLSKGVAAEKSKSSTKSDFAYAVQQVNAYTCTL